MNVRKGSLYRVSVAHTGERTTGSFLVCAASKVEACDVAHVYMRGLVGEDGAQLFPAALALSARARMPYGEILMGGE